MQRIITSTLLAVSVLASAQIFAGEDDTVWISKCMNDNKREGQATETVMLYCHCMNEKMSDNETKSITEWEKTHPKEEAECSAKAGWK